jgi:hypothetical protein
MLDFAIYKPQPRKTPSVFQLSEFIYNLRYKSHLAGSGRSLRLLKAAKPGGGRYRQHGFLFNTHPDTR